MRAVILLIFLFSIGLYSKMAHSIGADRDLNTAIITAKQIVTPSNPSAGFQRLYCKSDGKCYTLQSDGTETELGSGGGGSGFQELMADPSFENEEEEGVLVNATGDYIASPTLGPFDQLAREITFSSAGSYCVTKTTGANFAGLPSQVSCQVQTSDSGISFEHYSNGNLIASEDVLSDSSVKKYQPLVQGVIGATSEGWCVRSTGAATAIVNNCKISTESQLQNVGIASDPVDYTPTIVGMGTVSIAYAQWWREGAFARLKIKFTAGTRTPTEVQIGLPEGLVVSSSQTQIGKVGTVDTNLLTETAYLALATAGDSYLNLGFRNTSSAVAFTPQNGTAIFADGAVIDIDATVPIANWSAGQDALSSAGGGSATRLTGYNGYGSTATRIPRLATSRVSVGKSIAYEDSATTSTAFTVRSSGFYFGNYCANFATSRQYGISLNASSLTDNINSLAESQILAISATNDSGISDCVGFATWLWAGDIVRPHTQGDAISDATKHSFSIVGILDMITATLRDTLKVPNSSGNDYKYDNFMFNFGGTAITDCTASPCAYLNQIGNAVNEVTRSGAGAYNIAFSKTYLNIKCTVTPIAGGGNDISLLLPASNEPLSCQNCADLDFNTGTAGVASRDTFGVVHCMGMWQ